LSKNAKHFYGALLYGL